MNGFHILQTAAECQLTQLHCLGAYLNEGYLLLWKVFLICNYSKLYLLPLVVNIF